MYEQLLRAMASDIEAGGPTGAVLAGYRLDPHDSAVALRLAGALHRLVLDGEAEALTDFYPSVGGHWNVAEAWPVARQTLQTHRAVLRDRLSRPPQTNEVGRSAALLGGLLHVAARTSLPVRLHEIGASAGLNLHADRYRFGHRRGVWGPANSPVLIKDAWRGTPPPLQAPLTVIERHGTDASPVDITTSAGRMTLLCYVWPDQRARLTRLRNALRLPESSSVPVRRRSATDAVRDLRVEAGSVLVLWHSVMWQYLDHPSRAEITRLLRVLAASATPRAPLAHLCMEPAGAVGSEEFRVHLEVWPRPAGEDGPVVLGTAAPHGVPVTWRSLPADGQVAG